MTKRKRCGHTLQCQPTSWRNIGMPLRH
ncbi:hypothetical protein ID866_12304 [Astraeus odoratus]|nr:hypothetical protein ID866_12304 [Astraeus odoratus]